MKKILLIGAVIASMLSFSSCGVTSNLTSNQNQNQTSVVLSQNNYKVIGKTSAEVTGKYVLGFGNIRKKALKDNGIDEMMKKANLEGGSKAITNITVKSSVKMITPLYMEVSMTATGNIIEFTK